MPNRDNSFGEYLKELIKENGMTQVEFYTAWGIKKPYFYDIVSGRTSPPPYPLQFKAMEILNAEENTREKFFDLAAKWRQELPADIAKVISDNPQILDNIRSNLKSMQLCKK